MLSLPLSPAHGARLLMLARMRVASEVEPTTLASKHPILALADRFVPKLSVLVRYAFAMGRKRLPDTDAAIEATEGVLRKMLPKMLGEIAEAGKRAGELTIAESHKFASTQVDLTGDAVTKILAMSARVNEADLAEDGREEKPHVTLKWGLHDGDPFACRALLEGQPPIRLTFGKTSVFSSEEHDVVKVDVVSPDMERLHALLCDTLEHTATHDGYIPHATVAYVKPGLGAKYAGMTDLDGVTIEASEVMFSDQEDARFVIRLTGDGIVRAAELRTARTTKIDAKTKAARAWAEDHAAELIKGLSKTTRERVKAVIAEFVDRPSKMAPALRAALGDADRAEMIARTESMRAAHKGQQLLWQDAQEQGLLGETARRVWIVTEDEAACPICLALDGKTAPLDDAYDGGAEYFDGPPAHPSCRCTEGIA